MYIHTQTHISVRFTSSGIHDIQRTSHAQIIVSKYYSQLQDLGQRADSRATGAKYMNPELIKIKELSKKKRVYNKDTETS